MTTTPPMFKLFPLEELARRLDRSLATLIGMQNSPDIIGPRFQRMAATILGHTVDELFGTGEEIIDESSHA
jgi:hypothetical protein